MLLKKALAGVKHKSRLNKPFHRQSADELKQIETLRTRNARFYQASPDNKQEQGINMSLDIDKFRLLKHSSRQLVKNLNIVTFDSIKASQRSLHVSAAHSQMLSKASLDK